MVSVEQLESIRIEFNKLALLLQSAGRVKEAREAIALAVEQGLWREPLQRPIHFSPGIPGRPVHDPARFPFVPLLEESFPVIRAEVDAAESDRHFKIVKEDDLIEYGHWGQVVLFEGGQVFEENCSRFPKTWALLRNIPEVMAGAGAVYLSWLEPGTHIIPHFGPTNTRLRVHMGIKVPEGPSMRVKDTLLHWKEGEVIVFDDSFEHEVWNPSSEVRVVLLFDIFHPDLSEDERAAIPESQRSFEQRISAFLRKSEIDRIQREPHTGEIQFLPNGKAEKIINRYIDDLGQEAVYLEGDALRFATGRHKP